MQDNELSSVRTSFIRTWRAMAIAKLRSLRGLVLAVSALFFGWVIWLAVVRVPVYTTSRSAKFESEKLPLPVQPPVDGVVVQCNLRLSEHVRDGETLVRLDARDFELKKAQSDAALNAALDDVKSLQAEIDAQSAARAALADFVNKSASSGRAKVSVSKALANQKEREAEVVEKLSASELASKLDQMRVEGEQAAGRAQVAATSAAAAQELSGNNASLFDRDAQIAALRKALLDAQNQATIIKAEGEAVQYQIDLRNIRAFSKGTLADIAPCTEGMTVSTAQRLATLLPDGPTRVITYFSPQDAVGRIRPGQKAVMRVDNFPWTQFGTVGGVVDSVGSEPRNDLIRVELRVDRTNPQIPLINGLTGNVEVEIEKTTPFNLLLRAAGQWVVPKADASESSTPAPHRD